MKLATAFFLALAACASTAGSAQAQALFAADDTRVANEGTIGDKWALADGATLATPAYPPAMAARGDDVCLALGYLINPDGSTSDFAVLRQWNSGTGDQTVFIDDDGTPYVIASSVSGRSHLYVLPLRASDSIS